MECLVLEAAAAVPYLQISVEAIGRALVSVLISPCLESSCAKAVLFASIWSHSNSISTQLWLLALSLPLWPCFPLWTWCVFLVYMALTLGFPSKTLAWLLTGSSSEHPEYADFFRVYFLASNKLDQQQAGLTGQWIQWCQKALRNGHVHQGSMRNFELRQNHFP